MINVNKKLKDLTVLDLIALSVVVIRTFYPASDLSEFEKLVNQ